MANLDQLLSSVPKAILVAGGLGLGLLAIVNIKPMHSDCDSQLELFQVSQTPFLYRDSQKKYETTPRIVSAIANCRNSNSAGGCLEYFNGLRTLMNAFELSPKSCRPTIGADPSVQGAVSEAISLMVKLAWGERAPASSGERVGWFDSAHIFLFCRLEKSARTILDDDAWNGFRSSVAKKLPGAEGLEMADIWKLTLFSYPCQ